MLNFFVEWQSGQSPGFINSLQKVLDVLFLKIEAFCIFELS